MKFRIHPFIIPSGFFSWQILACVAVAILAASYARATTYDWVAAGASGNLTGNTTNWSPAIVPGTNDIAEWGNVTFTTAPTANAAWTVGELHFAGNQTGGVTFGLGNNTITLSGNATGSTGVGIQMDSGSGAVSTGSAKFAIGGSQSWTNNSSSMLTIGGNITNTANATAYTLTVGGTGNTTFSGSVSNNGTLGTLALTKNDAGALTFNNGSTFTGALTLNAGTIYASAVNNAVLGAGTLVLNGGTLDFNATSGLTVGRNTTVTGNTTIVSEKNTAGVGVNYTLGTLSIGAQTLNISGGNVNSGSANMTFGATTLTGNTTFNITNPVAGGATVLTLGAVTNGANTATFTGSGNFTQTGAWGNGAGGITLGVAGGNATNGGLYTGTAVFSQNNTYTGGLIVNSGTAYANTAATTATGFGSNATAILLGDTGGSNNATLALTGSLNGLTITNNITVRGGSTGNTLAITEGAGLQSAAVSGTIALNHDLVLAQAQANSGKSLTVSGNITGGSANNLIIGSAGYTNAGTVALTGTGNTFSGNLIVNSGTVSTSNATGFGTGTILLGDTAFSNNATLLSSTTGNITNNITAQAGPAGNTLTININGSGGTIGGNITMNHDLTIGATLGVQYKGNFSGAIGGGGNLTISGSGSTVVTGANTYTGTTTVTGTADFAKASLYGGNTANWTATNIKVASGGTLMVRVANAADVTALLTNLGGANGTSAGGFAAGSTLGIDTASGSITVNDTITDTNIGSGGGAFGVTAAGGNTLTLTGNNSFTGAAGVDATTNGSSTLSFSTVGNSNVNSNLGAGNTINLAANGTTGTATLIYTGSGSSTNRTINTGSQAMISSSGTGALTLTGNINRTTNALQLGGNYTGGINDIQGVINGTGGVTTVGVQSTGNNAIWQLSGPNTYTGTTTIGATGLAGNITLNVTTLRDFGTASSLGYGTVGTGITFINSTAVTPILNYVGTGDSSSNRTISLSATASGTTPAVVQNNGTGNLTFTAATTTTPFNVASATANVTRSLTLGGNNTGPNEIQGAIVNNSVNGTISLTKAGTGQWILSGNNTYTGNTTVSTGTLLVNGSTSSSSFVTVANGGTLRGSGTVGGAVSVLSGGTLGGVGTINGATSITGVLSPGNGDGLIGTLNIANNVTWLGAPSGSSATDWVFNLGPSNASDKLNITGTFNRDTSLGSVFQFDFAGSANRGAFTLASWTLTGGNDFQSTDFTWKNLALGYDGTFQIVDTDLQIVVVPEPATWALLAASLTTVVIFRRRRK